MIYDEKLRQQCVEAMQEEIKEDLVKEGFYTVCPFLFLDF